MMNIFPIDLMRTKYVMALYYYTKLVIKKTYTGIQCNKSEIWFIHSTGRRVMIRSDSESREIFTELGDN